MSTLSEAEAKIVREYPIRRSTLDDIMVDVEADYPAMLRSEASSEDVRTAASWLISRLALVNTATRLPSRLRCGESLNSDLRRLVQNDLRNLNLTAIALLTEKVVNRAADHEIWSAVYHLFPATPPTTPCPGVTVSSVLDTPFVASSGAVYNTDESRDYMDELIKSEMGDHIYLDLPDFFTTFFYSVDGLRSLAQAVFVECQRTASYAQARRWRSFPESCGETDVAAWFREEVGRIIEFALKETQRSAHAAMLTSRCVASVPHLPLKGSTAPRKLDIGFASSKEQCKWGNILVPGELKRNKANDSKFSTWCDLGRYVREVYAAQDTRRFSHGFTLCGDVMRVWRFDRGAVYAGPPFNVNEEGERFVAVVLGYLLMEDEELGYDTTISKDGDQRYISVVRNGTEMRFLIDKIMHRQPCIIGRGTTCWRATLGDKKYVVKDSWQNEGREDEGVLLTETTLAGIKNVAPCYHSENVRIGQLDDLRGSVRKELDVSTGKMWKPRKSTQITTFSNSSSSLRKRVASTTLENDQKRPRSNTEGESGTGHTQNCSAPNRLHKRIIMSRCGKPLYMASTRVGLLKGLIDGISGHQNLFLEMKILHRDISVGNVLLSEDETEGFLIDLDHAIRVDRTENSGARGRTGTKAFMSIGLLLQGESPNKKPHSFMDDLESMFWLLFWICVHYSGPGGKGKSAEYEEWNFRSPKKLGGEKAGLVGIEKDFLNTITDDFTGYFAPLIPWVNCLRREVFPGGFRWMKEDLTLYGRMKDVLQQAMDDPAVAAG